MLYESRETKELCNRLENKIKVKTEVFITRDFNGDYNIILHLGCFRIGFEFASKISFSNIETSDNFAESVVDKFKFEIEKFIAHGEPE